MIVICDLLFAGHDLLSLQEGGRKGAVLPGKAVI